MPQALYFYTPPGSEMVKKTLANLVNATLHSHENGNYEEYAKAWKLCAASHLLRKSRIRNLHEHWLQP